MDKTMWRTWLAWLSMTGGTILERPLCEMHSPNTPVSGFLSQGNLILDEGCRYRLFEKSNAASCLKGNWIAVTGSSNALLQFLGTKSHAVGFYLKKDAPRFRTVVLIVLFLPQVQQLGELFGPGRVLRGS